MTFDKDTDNFLEEFDLLMKKHEMPRPSDENPEQFLLFLAESIGNICGLSALLNNKDESKIKEQIGKYSDISTASAMKVKNMFFGDAVRH